MAAYAALASLMHIVDQIEHHPRPPISLHKQQVQSLTQNVAFLQDFLEGYSHLAAYRNEAERLECRIADAAYAAEDIIESHIVDQIQGEKGITSVNVYEYLQKVKEEMDVIRAEVMQIKEKMGIQDHDLVGSLRSPPMGQNSTKKRKRAMDENTVAEVSLAIKEKMGIQDQGHRSRSVSAGSLRSTMWENSTKVSFGEIFGKIIDKLIDEKSNLEIIPIVGMGGIGKTTLARYLYEYPLTVHHFDVFAWVTVSVEYNVKEILLELLCCVEKKEHKGKLIELDQFELGDRLYKHLYGRRYFIIMDDVWSVQACDKVRVFCPNNNNGSRIMITTRLSNLAFELCGSQSHGFQMNFLDENKSWDLLCKSAFGNENCPTELEEIGKIITRNCKGLPLSIVVIGGLLKKSDMTPEFWEYIAENLNSTVNSEEGELCLQILYLSYCQLPVHLKPCFLYMGVFAEDRIVRVSEIIKLWVAEGFLRPVGGKSLEEAAQEYIKELIDRNLVLVHKLGYSGDVKLCKVHDLLRDLCLKEADKQKFLGLVMQQNLSAPQCGFNGRRIAIHQCTSVKKYHSRVGHASLARSLIWDFDSSQYGENNLSLKCNSGKLRLLRIFKLDSKFRGYGPALGNKHFQDGIFELFNSRYLSHPYMGPSVPSSISRFWNLHTLIARRTSTTAPPEIWKMHLLKHVEFRNIHLPDPPNDMGYDVVLGNLQTLFRIGILDVKKVVERIPNIKKLKIYQGEFETFAGYLKYLSHLHKLEYIRIHFGWGMERALLRNLTFPHSLKKLVLNGCCLHWEDMTTKIGSLPLLEVLKLEKGSFIGSRWETVEGDFCRLKYLLICCPVLKYWYTESTHFPCLEHLHLHFLWELEEIPLDIGEIPTLQSIELEYCTSSAVNSAKRILQEQEEIGNEALHVRVAVLPSDSGMESLRSPNFHVEKREYGSRTSHKIY